MVKKKQVRKKKKKAVPLRRTKAKQARARVKLSAKKKAKSAAKRPRGKAESAELLEYRRRGLGASTGGQSGDTQGIPARLRADSESVEELLEEGQTFEAEAIAGVESAPDPDESEVVTHEFPEDDVPEEYRERDE